MASRLSTILTNIAGVAVTSDSVTTTAKVLTSMPNSLRTAAMPMRLVLCNGTAGDEGIRSLTVSGGLQQAVWEIRDVFVWKPLAQGGGLDDALPALVNYTAAYAGAFASQKNIATNSVIEDISAEITTWEYPADSGTVYHIVEHVLLVRETFS